MVCPDLPLKLHLAFGFIHRVDNVNWLPLTDSKADVSSVSPSIVGANRGTPDDSSVSPQEPTIPRYAPCSDEGLTLETSRPVHSGQFTLSTQLIKPNYLVILPTDAVSLESTPPPLSYIVVLFNLSLRHTILVAFYAIDLKTYI